MKTSRTALLRRATEALDLQERDALVGIVILKNVRVRVEEGGDVRVRLLREDLDRRGALEEATAVPLITRIKHFLQQK